MADDKRSGRGEAGTEPDPKATADRFRGISAEIGKEAATRFRGAGAAGVELSTKDNQMTHIPARNEDDQGVRDKHRHIKDTQQESLIAQPAAGYGAGGSQQQTQAREATAKSTEQAREIKPTGAGNGVAQAKTGNASEKAISPEIRNAYEANQKALNEEARSMRGGGVEEREGEPGQGRPASTANPKTQQREGPTR